jgi:hypothetical protein
VNGQKVSAVSTAEVGKCVHDEIDGGRIWGIICWGRFVLATVVISASWFP